MAKNDMITWGLVGLAALALGYFYITSQKANGKQGIAVGEPNPSAPKPCGCGMEPASHAESFATSAVPSTG